MSELTTVARPYAKAIFEVAQQEGTLADWLSRLTALSSVVSTEGARQLLGNPRLSREQKLDAISSIVGDELGEQGRSLLSILAENDRVAVLPEMAVLFEQLKASAEGIVEAEITSAYELTEEQQNVLTNALEKRFGREVRLDTKVDPSLMGGAVIRAGDLVIDGSIQSRLKDMKTALSR